MDPQQKCDGQKCDPRTFVMSHFCLLFIYIYTFRTFAYRTFSIIYIYIYIQLYINTHICNHYFSLPLNLYSCNIVILFILEGLIGEVKKPIRNCMLERSNGVGEQLGRQRNALKIVSWKGQIERNWVKRQNHCMRERSIENRGGE